MSDPSFGGPSVGGFPKEPMKVERTDPIPQNVTSKYHCPDCGAPEGDWHRRYCLVGAEKVRP